MKPGAFSEEGRPHGEAQRIGSARLRAQVAIAGLIEAQAAAKPQRLGSMS